MQRLKLVALLGICSLFFSVASMADEFNLTVTGTGLDITGTLDATASGTPGVFYITDFSGSVNGQTASLLPTSGPGIVTTSPVLGGIAFGFNNVLYTDSPFLDVNGLGLALADGNFGNLLSLSNTLYDYFEITPNGLGIAAVGSATLTPIGAVAEPASLLLLGMGLLGFCMTMVVGKMRNA